MATRDINVRKYRRFLQICNQPSRRTLRLAVSLEWNVRRCYFYFRSSRRGDREVYNDFVNLLGEGESRERGFSFGRIYSPDFSVKFTRVESRFRRIASSLVLRLRRRSKITRVSIEARLSSF